MSRDTYVTVIVFKCNHR